jgi:hypothetical protein
MVYRLDGSESKNTQAGRGGQSTEIVSKAMFEGNALSITTQRPGRDGGPGVTQKTTLTLNNGQMEVDNAVDGGAGGPGGGRGGGGKQVYKKN